MCYIKPFLTDSLTEHCRDTVGMPLQMMACGLVIDAGTISCLEGLDSYMARPVTCQVPNSYRWFIVSTTINAGWYSCCRSADEFNDGA